MSAPDQNANQLPPKDRPQRPAPGLNPSFVSLTRTLEDLEQRLARLSTAKQAIAGAGRDTAAPTASDEPRPDQPTASATPASSTDAAVGRLEDSASGLAMRAAARPETPVRREADSARGEAARNNEDGSRRSSATSALDRRFSTIAGEVESLQMQGATLRLITDVADDLQSLRSEIRDNGLAVAETQFESVRASFIELRQMIEGRSDSGRIGSEIVEILDRLSNLQTTGFDRQSIDSLRAEIDGVGSLVSQLAREETLASVNRRWDEFETRIAEQVELDGAARRDLRSELERLRESVRSLASDEQIRAVEQRWEEFESRHLDQVRVQTEEQLNRLLKDELESLRTRLDAMAVLSLPETLSSRLDTMEQNLSTDELEAGMERLGQRVADIEQALTCFPDAPSLARLEQRILALSGAIADFAERHDNPDLEHFIILEERLDEISQAIVARVVTGEIAGLDMAPIERIEARIADLSTRVDALVADGSADMLSERIAELSDRIGRLSAEPAADLLDERMQAFAARFESLLAEARPSPEAVMFEERLAALADRLEGAAATRVDEDLVRSLESQIQSLSSQLSGHSGDIVVEADPELETRLGAIERRLDENREELMAAARLAADEAVRLMTEEGGRREGEHVRELSEDLRNLEALSRQTDDRSIMVFEAVHTTLLKIVERLAKIEREIVEGAGLDRSERGSGLFAGLEAEASARTQEAWQPPVVEETPALQEAKGLRAAIARHLRGRARPSAAMATPEVEEPPVSRRISSEAGSEPSQAGTDRDLLDAPALDAADSIISREANRPLEPGSGTPDIASLLERVRQQQIIAADESSRPSAKADFIAAARKAAMAAATEAEALKASAEAQEDEVKDRPSLRRKPILMAVGAVLLALMAIPLGRTLMENGRVSSEEASAAGGEVAPMVAEAAPVTPMLDTMEVGSIESQPATEMADPIVAEAVPAPAPARPRNALVQQGLLHARPYDRPVSGAPAITTAVASSTPASPIASPMLAGMATPIAVPDLAVATAFERPEPPVVSEAPVAPATADFDADRVMAQALAQLPEGVAGNAATAPSGIGPTALVAAADAGDAKALFEIGLRLLEGHNGEPKPADALVWFARSGERGFAPAQYSLGTLYEKGKGVERRAKAARDWYMLAAKNGNVRAMHNLAVLYATGIDGLSEPETAALWFDEAARRGMRDSQYNVGILRARGAGVAQDYGQSYKWFTIAGATGDKDALAKRDVVAKSLSAKERAALDAEAAAFVPMSIDAAANTVEIPPEWTEIPDETASIAVPAAAAAAPSETPAVEVDVTRAIRNVQAILGRLGFDAGPADGVVGARTTRAVTAFQQQNGLPATGQIDEALIRALLEKKDAA